MTFRIRAELADRVTAIAPHFGIVLDRANRTRAWPIAVHSMVVAEFEKC
jgi:hypothetical protein